jgi:hypothetical protein
MCAKRQRRCAALLALLAISSARAPPGRRFQTVWKLGEGEENITEAAKLTRPEEETLLALLRRADALNTACLAVELEEWAYPGAKAEMLETLEDMRVDAHEWFVSYKRALGIPDPLA